MGGDPETHSANALQISSPLQELPSLQLVPAGAGSFETPVTGSHESIVQGSPSSKEIGS
jgi:hypothetical protein